MRIKTISIHSSRGGSGKSLIATNLAVIFASRGFNVALLDLDFRAPSLAAVFSNGIKIPVECWLNDFLNGECSAEQVFTDLSATYNLSGKLLIGLANPAMDAMRNVMKKSRAWEVTAVKRLFSLLHTLDDMEVDFCISDTSPGMQYSSINAIVSSDIAMIVTTMDSLDLKGTEDLLAELYDALDKNAVVLVNKSSPSTRIKFIENEKKIADKLKRIFKHPVIGVIPCYCDVLQTERTTLLALEKPNHLFVKDLMALAERLENTV